MAPKVGRRDFVKLGLGSTAGLTLGLGLAQTSRTGPLNLPTPGPGLPGPDANVTTHSNDNHRTGAYLAETSLTPALVNKLNFGKLYERAVQGDIYAQPLYVRGVATAQGKKNLIFIATSTNDLYAYDADNMSADPYAGRVWHRSLNPWRPLVINREICNETIGSVGITSTPVIDVASQTMYVVTRRSGGRIVASGGQLYQLHNDGKIWHYTGTPCNGSCPGWELLDNNPATIQIAANGGSIGLFQLHRDGKIWQYTGPPIIGWQMIDNTPSSVAIAAAGSGAKASLCQIQETGTIREFDALSSWITRDNNVATTQIVTAATSTGTVLYQLRRDGSIWKYAPSLPNRGGSTPPVFPPPSPWQQLDNYAGTVQLAAAGPDLYQLHSDGSIWKYTGTPMTGWQRIDNFTGTISIVASPGAGLTSSALYQLHEDGSIWTLAGSGWTMLDNNNATAQILADNTQDTLYQVHIDGSIWRYTGSPCSGNSCQGWQMLDNNWALDDGANYLHAVNITDGTERLAPVKIQATGPNGITFDSRYQRNRPGLLLLNGFVYVAFGTFSCDGGPYHGWVLGYRASDLSQVAACCTSADSATSRGAGIWQSGAGLVGGDDGSIWFETGNDFYGNKGDQIAFLGDSFVKLQQASSGNLAYVNRFQPSDVASILRDGDTDLGSGGPVLLPGGRLVGGGKQGRLYVLNTATVELSQNNPDKDGYMGFQAFQNTWHPNSPIPDYAKGELFGPNIHGNPIYWPGTNYIYKMAEKDYLKAFQYDPGTGTLKTTPAATAAGSWARPLDGMPGGFSSISANGNANGIIWTSLPQQDGQYAKVSGALAAFDAVTLKQLWSDDSPVSFAKFCPPTIADGKVIRATFASNVHHGIPGKFIVYGQLPLSVMPYGFTRFAAVRRMRTIEEAYWDHGGPLGSLGRPVGEEQAIGDAAGGRFRNYVRVPGLMKNMNHAGVNDHDIRPQAAIYWAPEYGAHAVEGEILALWRKMGAEKSWLVYPTAGETNAPDGRGRISRFENGDIVWRPETGATLRQRKKGRA